ncbi:MAG: hypothetical protein LBC71_01340 [Oscillospiraceae bacterium]|jgi:mRNA-degrading endonuclease RelE of RelBE toxin-antitoxin system|nr:hypothetical protein [Oscillospiraceae bacterium]
MGKKNNVVVKRDFGDIVLTDNEMSFLRAFDEGMKVVRGEVELSPARELVDELYAYVDEIEANEREAIGIGSDGDEQKSYVAEMESDYKREYKVGKIAEFDRNAKRFIKKKKFKSLPKQIDELIEQFEKGGFKGDRILHSKTPVNYDIYKLRLPNPDTNTGKSGGYRVIYLVVTKAKIVVLLTIYYKKETSDVTDAFLKWLVDGYFLGKVIFDESSIDVIE